MISKNDTRLFQRGLAYAARDEIFCGSVTLVRNGFRALHLFYVQLNNIFEKTD